MERFLKIHTLDKELKIDYFDGDQLFDENDIDELYVKFSKHPQTDEPKLNITVCMEEKDVNQI